MNTSTPAAPSRLKTILRRLGIGVAVTIAAAAVIFAAGPRNQFGPDQPTAREAPPDSTALLDDWLKKQESAYKDIKPDAEKGIVWHSERKEKTPWAVVNIHGFSASRQESAPVPDLIAKALSANRYEARLTGHGRSGAAMAEPSVQDWLADVVEAARIGHTIGERVVLIGTSTGATLGTWLATRPEGSVVDAYVFVSPNYAPRNPSAKVTNWPWGKQIALASIGETRRWEPSNPRVPGVWSNSYPTRAVFPMMALVKHVGDMDLSAFKAPVLMLYSEQDKVINTEEVRKAFGRVGGTKKDIEVVTYSDDGNQHNLASDILAPKAVPQLSDTIIKWVKSLPAK